MRPSDTSAASDAAGRSANGTTADGINGVDGTSVGTNGAGIGANDTGIGVNGASGSGNSASGNGAKGNEPAANNQGRNGGAAGADGAATNVAMCGNGIVDMGETCDPVGTCPTLDTCTSTNVCLQPSVVGMPSMCTAKCELRPIEECKSGDGCCPKGCNKSMDEDCSDSCGDGVIGTGEVCEPTNAALPCPTSCDDMDPCTSDMQTGTSAQCNVACTHTPITQPASGDMCCPPGANANNDPDCRAMCGNGVKEGSEICDGDDCPSSCDDGDPCTADKLMGSATACTAVCSNTAITRPAGGDGCCPDGANSNNDSDCSAKCGNGVREGSEKCDGSDCPSSCDDRNPCTMDITVGSAGQCTADCSHRAITGPANNDGCCPDRANANNDNDCRPSCGNGVREGSETCDGAADCARIKSMCANTGSICKTATYIGSEAACTLDCGAPTVRGTNGGEPNVCGGCNSLEYPGAGAGNTTTPTKNLPCKPSTSSYPECATAGLTYCVTQESLGCRLIEAVRIHTDGCKDNEEYDDDCDGVRDDEGVPSKPPCVP